MKILVRNLPRTVTEAELKVMFDEHGTVQSCSLVMDKNTGGSKGFGFIEMPKVGEAKIAIKALNSKTIGDKKIRVKKAEEKAETTPKRMSEADPSSTAAEVKSEEIAPKEPSKAPAILQEQVAQQPRKHDPYGKSKR